MVLEVSSVTKRFGAITLLDAVSFSVARGEVVALTGESGSGKSTLMHIVAGLEPFDTGEVVIDGAAISALDDAGRARLRLDRIGIVFQQFNLIPSLSAEANLAFQARLRGIPLDTASLAGSLGLADHIEKYPDQLSGGQQQRVAIGRALAADPALVLADEPTGNLDEETGDAVFDLLIAQARERNAALLIITHSERLAARADRRLHLAHGRIQS